MSGVVQTVDVRLGVAKKRTHWTRQSDYLVWHVVCACRGQIVRVVLFLPAHCDIVETSMVLASPCNFF